MIDEIASGEAIEESSTVDLSTFERTLSLKDLATEFRVRDVIHFPTFILPIETLSPRRTVGKGRTNLTFIEPDIVQTDTTGSAYAAFTRREGQRDPAISIHFEPSAYGITSSGNYAISFAIATDGPVTLSVGAFAGAGTATGTGVKNLNGTVSVDVRFGNLPALSQVYASITQTAGSRWTWYSTSIEHPPLVLSP